ncbi:MAG: beta-ketoacyl-[acyl-carrier-protein] synthase family protein [Pseudoxanthomonas sp.]
MSRRNVAITGMGLMCPVGQSLEQAVAALREVRSGIRLHQAPPIDKPFPAGVVEGEFDERFAKLERPFLDRTQHLAILAADQAIAQAGLDADFSALGLRAGVYYANVNGGAATTQGWLQQLLAEHRQIARPFTAMAAMGNAGGAQVAIRHRVRGPVITNASACGSSGVAIGEAARAIADGHLDVAVAGGAEAPLVAGVLGSFAGTRAMAPPDPADVARSCRPFSSARTGLVLGEGAAFLLLEEAGRAQARGAPILAYLAGYGISCDAYHIGQPESGGQIEALKAALASAGLHPDDIGYINAHATATQGGDVIEADAIRAVFGDAPTSAAVSSTKSLHGHMLGATSAVELVLTVLAMNERFLPASAFLGQADGKCALNHVGEQPRQVDDLAHALSFSCGFGGTNVALVVSTSPRHLHPSPS